VSINGATGILLNITGGPDLTLAEMNEACSLIAEAADPEANIIFGSVIDANAGDTVRITVIATGFNAHAHEHPAPTAGRGTARGREGQMALPMQASRMEQAPTMVAQQAPMGPWGQVSNPTPRGGYAAPVQRPGDSGESINLDEFYSSMAEVPPASMGAVPSAPQPNGPEWTPSERHERPMARPQNAPPVPPGARRTMQQQSPRAADELGVEESEFDKPTYLRRGLYAPE